MGSLSWVRVCIAVMLLLVTGFAVNLRHDSTPRSAGEPLFSVLTGFGEWRMTGDIPLDSKIQEELKLDDYLYRRFSDGKQTVILYVGYYHAATKVGAAHDPLVCFPGQGWMLRENESVSDSMTIQGEKIPLSYATMVAEQNDNKELLFYWFQADTRMASSTLMQKLLLVQSKILGHGQHNAFVRLSLDLKTQSIGEGRQAMQRFISDFYPAFLDYVSRSGLGRG